MKTTFGKIGKVLIVLSLASLVLAACAVNDQPGTGQTSGGNGNGAGNGVGRGVPFTGSEMERGRQSDDQVPGNEVLPGQGMQGWGQEEGIPGSEAGPVGQDFQGRGQGGARGGRGGNLPAYESGQSMEPLSQEEQDGLKFAILEEYGALNLYQSVMDQFGQVEPFASIARSEQQHVNALLRQAEKYGVTAPEKPEVTQTTTYATIADACQAGVGAEIADAALYDDLMPVTVHTDLLRVYESLKQASLENHLPAFEACQ